jgi:type IV secretory pathway VirJ component
VRRLALGLLLAARAAAGPLPADDPLSDLPLVEVPADAASSSDLLAVIVSGDGGWARLDRTLAGLLAARGVPVVGLDSLRYFWTRRTPDEAGAALGRVLDHQLRKWPARRAILIGYSRGADVLPFMASRLPARLREAVALIVLIGPGQRVELEFHVTDWALDRERAAALPILPEVTKLRGTKLLCVYGAKEPTSLCPALPKGAAELEQRPGAHHFDGDYAAIAEKILAAAGK